MRSFALIFTLILISFSLTAQDTLSRSNRTTYTERLKGFVIDLKGDTSFVTFVIPFYRYAIDYAKLRVTGIRLIYDSGGNKITVNLKNTKLFSFYSPHSGSHGEQVNMVYFDPINFLKLQVDGELKLMISYFDAPVGRLSRRSTKPFEKAYFIRKRDDKPVRVSYRNFNKQMTNYFSESSEIVKKINGEVYTYQDIEKIVKEYNSSNQQ